MNEPQEKKTDIDNLLSPQHSATILDSITDGVFTVDLNWRISSFNRAAEQITGIPREEALGKRCCDVFRASICESECALRHTMDTGKPVVNKVVRIVDAEGGVIPISISTALLKDKGRVIGGVETFRDLSLVEQLRKELTGRHSFADIISKNHRMKELLEILPTLAVSDSTVLIEGDSGTGKELYAKALHDLSSRRKKPFVTVNCGALPDTLLESELFGYKAGAFTDAKKDKPGRFAQAGGGTIFLDEIGDVSPALQVRLLRVLQDKTFEPLGGTQTVKADVRVVAATNKSLTELVKDGSFRQDLYYRINVVRVDLPPLRERKEDIPLLIEHFIGRFNKLRGKDIAGVSSGAAVALLGHDYPGNIRELENIVEYAFVVCPGGIIESCHLPENLRQPLPHPPEPADSSSALKQVEKRLIYDTLKRNHWNRLAAARELGIHKSTLFRKIKSMGLELPATDGRSTTS
jgi:PAS domain S-box-containing protein